MEYQSAETYLTERLDAQLQYFDKSAMRNQRRYRLLKRVAIGCNLGTTLTIALVFVVPAGPDFWLSILALVLSTFVLATYQVEEFENYGAKWEKFRLVAEQLKSERYMFVARAGKYGSMNEEQALDALVQSVESTIRGTDVSYFALMVDPGRRIEKRLGGELGSRDGGESG